MFAFLCRCRLVWCVILLIMLMPVWSLCLTSSPRCFPSSRFRTPHSLSSVAFRTVQISRLPFYFFCALFLLFSSSLCPLLYARVWNFIFYFFFLLACCLLHGNCLCWGICGNKCNPYDPYDPTACIVVLRAQRVREGWAGKEIDGQRERRREHPQARACEFCTECDLLLVFIVIFWSFTVS